MLLNQTVPRIQYAMLTVIMRMLVIPKKMFHSQDGGAQAAHRMRNSSFILWSLGASTVERRDRSSCGHLVSPLFDSQIVHTHLKRNRGPTLL